jgi:hypothetical protein
VPVRRVADPCARVRRHAARSAVRLARLDPFMIDGQASRRSPIDSAASQGEPHGRRLSRGSKRSSREIIGADTIAPVCPAPLR